MNWRNTPSNILRIGKINQRDTNSDSASPLVSIIIRTKNEERWIGACLRAVFNQNYPSIEVVLVDNRSTDRTVDKSKAFDVNIVHIDEFLPGKAINFGIEKSKGEIIVCLSGHCIPTGHGWLSSLIQDLEDENVAGVYGRQEPMSFSTDFDKRDLITVFGLDKKIQKNDPFFHNANSAFRRSLWEKIPFNAEVTNIEDRVWAREVLSRGYSIHYEPDASVYHYHGIHQDMDRQRARQVVQIMEAVHGAPSAHNGTMDNSLDIVAIVPAKGEIHWCAGEPMLKHPIEDALNSRYVTDVIVSTDNPEVAALAEKLGARAPFLRPPELSEEYVDVREVFQFTLEKLEQDKLIPDLVVVLEETYPFRPQGLIDDMISALQRDGFDSMIAAKEEFRHMRQRVTGRIEDFGEGHMPRHLKEMQVLVDLMGLGFVTHPTLIRDGSLFGAKVGVYDVNSPLGGVEVRDEAARLSLTAVMKTWLEEKYNSNS